MIIERRKFLVGVLGGLMAAPLVVRAASIMKVKSLVVESKYSYADMMAEIQAYLDRHPDIMEVVSEAPARSLMGTPTLVKYTWIGGRVLTKIVDPGELATGDDRLQWFTPPPAPKFYGMGTPTILGKLS